MITQTKPQFGQWYLTITCPQCQSKLILFPDLTEGQSDLHRSRYLLRCPECRRLADGRVEHYQHGQRAETAIT